MSSVPKGKMMKKKTVHEHQGKKKKFKTEISIHAPVWGTTGRRCPACGLIGSHVVPNIPRCYQKLTTGPRLKRERSMYYYG